MGILLLGLLIAVFGICCYVFLDILVFKQNANKKKQFIIYNFIASVFAVFAILTSYIWVYWFVLLYSLPSLVVSALFTWKSSRIISGKFFTKINYALIALSLIISIVSFILVYFK